MLLWWLLNKYKEPEKEPVDIMPFLYIGFMGLIGYILMRSQ